MLIYSHNKGSEGAKELSRSLNIKRIKHEGSRFKGSQDKVVLNWGSSRLPVECTKCQVINQPDSVRNASNKATFFDSLDDERFNLPPNTQDAVVAREWYDNGDLIVARQVLSGHSGAGIVLFQRDSDKDGVSTEFVNAPLYTKYIKKSQEFRAHVLRGEIIDVQRKARSSNVPDENVNWMVRNHSNGFIFAREGVELPEVALNLCISVVAELHLDFGAVDLIYNEHSNKYYVLEVNTAPGLTGTTLTRYTEAFRELV